MTPGEIDVFVVSNDIRGGTGFSVNGRLVCYALSDRFNVANVSPDADMLNEVTVRGRPITILPSGTPTGTQKIGSKAMGELLNVYDPDYVITVMDVDMVDYLVDHHKPRQMNITLRDHGNVIDRQEVVDQVVSTLSQIHPESNFIWIAQIPIDGDPLPPAWEGIFHEIDQVVTMSQYGSQVLQNQFDITAPHIPHAIDTEPAPGVSSEVSTERLLGDSNNLIFGSVNANHSRKQHPRLLRAWTKFYRQEGKPNDVKFYLHTDPKSNAGWPIQEYAEFYGIRKAMIPYLGQLPRPQLIDLYDEIDVFCSATSGEGFGLTTIEAMSQGCPVVITDYATSEELVQYGSPTPRGSLITPETMYDDAHLSPVVERALVDVDKFADVLSEYYQNREEIQKEGANAKKWVQNHLQYKDVSDMWRKVINPK